MDSNFRIQCLWHKRTVVTRSRNEEGLWGFVLLLLLWIIQYYSLLIRSDEQYLLIYWQKIKPRHQKNLTCPSSRSGSTAHRDPLCLPLYAPWAASKARSVSTCAEMYCPIHACSLWLTLQWISTLMVSRLRFVLRTLMNSIRGRILMPCGEEGKKKNTNYFEH